MDKIIGFTISKGKIDHSDVDIFRSGLNIKNINQNGFDIYIWGVGNLENCIVNGKYSLSCPLNENLLDRNVLISLSEKSVIVENDWLGSIPVFYNTKDVIVSTLCLKAFRNKVIDPEGLNNYFEFGYSVFEQTPFLDVKFLRYFSKIRIDEGGIVVE